MEGADLAVGSLREAGHDLGFMRGWECSPCLGLPLVLR